MPGKGNWQPGTRSSLWVLVPATGWSVTCVAPPRVESSADEWHSTLTLWFLSQSTSQLQFVFPTLRHRNVGGTTESRQGTGSLVPVSGGREGGDAPSPACPAWCWTLSHRPYLPGEQAGFKQGWQRAINKEKGWWW